MATNEDQKTGSENQSDYEAAVLDFLDKEMAATQPETEENESGEELDAIVTDLLQQVITEADPSSQEQAAASDGLEDVMAEFPPTEVEEESSEAGRLESSESVTDRPADTEKDTAAKPTEESAESPSNERHDQALFEPATASKVRTPAIAIAAVCVLAAIGGAIYYFMGSSQDTSIIADSQSAISAPAFPENQQSTSQPAQSPSDKVVEQKEETPEPVAKSAAPPLAKSTPIKTAPKPETTKAAPAKTVIAKNQSASKQITEPELPIITPLPAQTEGPSPLAQSANVEIDRYEPPPMPERVDSADSGARGGSIPPISNPLSAPKSSTQSSPPNASAASATRTPVPAVPISRVSPVYPELAIRARTSGNVVLDVQIDKSGRVVKATPVEGPSVFYDAAVKAVMQWRYRPATIGKANVASKTRVTMVFNLER